MHLLLLFNQGWCIPPNLVSHRLQIVGVPAVYWFMGADAADLRGILSAGDLSIVLLESTTMAVSWYFLGIRPQAVLKQPEATRTV